MDKNINDIVNSYNSISDNKLLMKDFISILPTVNLITNKIDFDDVEMISLIDTLLLFKKLNLLDSINIESLTILSKALGNDADFFNEDKEYFCKRLKHFLIPFNLNHCDLEANLFSFLAEFDLMIDAIILNFNSEDYQLLNKYNHELCEVLARYRVLIEKYIKTITNCLVSDSIIINSTITRLITTLYFSIDQYNYDYDLIIKVFDRIMNNYQEYLLDCYSYGIYQGSINNIFNPENVLNEYIICKDMLDREFNPPIRLIRERI